MDAETKIRLTNIPPYDGEYVVLDRAFTAREWRWIRQISEGEIRPDKFNLSDPDFAIALAVIGLHRAGKITRDEALGVAEMLADVPLDDAHIVLLIGEEEVEEIPPALTSEPPAPSPNGSLTNDASRTPSDKTSGNDTRSDSGRSDENPEISGTTRSAMSSTLAPTS